MAEANKTEQKNDQGIIDSTKDAIKSRINNPFIGSFVIAWIVWNWEALLFLLFANHDIVRKIEILKLDYLSKQYVYWGPIGIAVFISLLSPYMLIFIRWYQDWANSRIRLNEILHLERVARRENEYNLLKQGFDISKDYTATDKIISTTKFLISTIYLDIKGLVYEISDEMEKYYNESIDKKIHDIHENAIKNSSKETIEQIKRSFNKVIEDELTSRHTEEINNKGRLLFYKYNAKKPLEKFTSEWLDRKILEFNKEYKDNDIKMFKILLARNKLKIVNLLTITTILLVMIIFLSLKILT